MSFISTETVLYQPKAKPRVKNEGGTKTPRRKYHITITKVETEVTVNPYKKSTDDGFTFREPCVLLVKVAAKTWEGIPCYFTSRLEFVRARGLRKGDYYAKLKTDFVSVNPSPDNSAVVFLRVHAGDSLWITGIEEEKVSRKGAYYLKLSRVKIVNEM